MGFILFARNGERREHLTGWSRSAFFGGARRGAGADRQEGDGGAAQAAAWRSAAGPLLGELYPAIQTLAWKRPGSIAPAWGGRGVCRA